MKLVNLQCVYTIPDSYPWIARNRDGILCGFMNPPVRDFSHEAWVDSTDGSYGEMIIFDKWDVSVREVSTLKDCTEAVRKTVKGRQIKSTEDFRQRRKSGKSRK